MSKVEHEEKKEKAEPVERSQPKANAAREPHTPARYPIEEHSNIPAHQPVSNEVVYYPERGRGGEKLDPGGQPRAKAARAEKREGDATLEDQAIIKQRTTVALNNHPMDQELANMLRDYWDEHPLTTSDYQFPADPHAVTVG